MFAVSQADVDETVPCEVMPDVLWSLLEQFQSQQRENAGSQTKLGLSSWQNEALQGAGEVLAALLSTKRGFAALSGSERGAAVVTTAATVVRWLSEPSLMETSTGQECLPVYIECLRRVVDQADPVWGLSEARNFELKLGLEAILTELQRPHRPESEVRSAMKECVLSLSR